MSVSPPGADDGLDRSCSDGEVVDEAPVVRVAHVELDGAVVAQARATADLFPAYDDDGGLLLVLTPAK